MENLLPLCGKVPETRFHCVELFQKHVSIVWKNPGNMVPLRGKTAQFGFHAVENGEFDFHTVELFAAQ